MAKSNYFNGLLGVVFGSIVGIAIVFRLHCNSWWQIVAAVIVGGFVGLLVADPKWTLEKLARGFKVFSKKAEDTSLPKKKKISAALFFFNASVTARWILTFASVFSLLLAPAATKILFHVNLSEHDFKVTDLAILPFVLLIGLLVTFFLTPLFSDEENFITRKYWRKLMCSRDGSIIFSKRGLLEYCGFWEAERRMLLIGANAAFRMFLLYLQIALFIPTNILFGLVAAVYLLRAIGKSARHILIFSNIALGIVVGACCSSLFQAIIWGLISGVAFYHVSFQLSRLPFAKLSQAYRGLSKIWYWKFS